MNLKLKKKLFQALTSNFLSRSNRGQGAIGGQSSKVIQLPPSTPNLNPQNLGILAKLIIMQINPKK